MRVLVCGGRNFKDYLLVKKVLNEIHDAGGHPYDNEITDIIEGGATGADALAREWTYNTYRHDARYIRLWDYPADWKTHGKAAGPIRNQTMLTEGRPDLCVAFPGGRGTADMVARARAAGVEVREINASMSDKDFHRALKALEKANVLPPYKVIIAP